MGYTKISEYISLREAIWTLLLSLPIPGKALAPGRLVVLNHKGLTNILGIVLGVDLKAKQRTFQVLICSNAESVTDPALENKALDDGRRDLFMGLVDQKIQVSDVMNNHHSLINLTDDKIIHITNKTIKIEPDKIINDIKKREIPRFKYDPPAQSVASALQQLIKFTDQMSSVEVPADVLSLKDFKVQDLDLVSSVQKMITLKDAIEMMECRTAPDISKIFGTVYEVMSVRDEIDRMEYLCSEASLALLPDYNCRIAVLRQLQYIDNNKVVQLKGRVGCEMGSNELILTELVFENKLTDRPPEEIAALLSCMVFQQKNCSEPELTSSLKQGVEDIKMTATKIGEVQVDCGLLEPVGDFVESFNFGLVEVVYEWARGMPFSDITSLTDVQEGIIVRTIQRLDETLRDVKDAARVIGDPVLYQKMDAASSIIKRDIVFAASLYTQ